MIHERTLRSMVDPDRRRMTRRGNSFLQGIAPRTGDRGGSAAARITSPRLKDNPAGPPRPPTGPSRRGTRPTGIP